MILNWKVSKTEAQLINALAKRASKMAKMMGVNYPVMTADMDLTACHLNGNPLDLVRMMAADDQTLGHDFFGIRHHINRETGKLENCFVPRFSARKTVEA